MESTAGLRLPAALAAFSQECPRADLSLINGPTGQLVRDVLEFRLDGVLVSDPVRRPDLMQTPVFEERLVLVTTPRVADLDAVLQDPRILVFRTGCSYRRRLESILHARGAVGVRCTEFGTLDGILGCVGAGMGVSLLPAAVVEQHTTHAVSGCQQSHRAGCLSYYTAYRPAACRCRPARSRRHAWGHDSSS
ncbi:LysR substrate-binding domain-containing protein [Streptomyces sp. NPDC055400]